MTKGGKTIKTLKMTLITFSAVTLLGGLAACGGSGENLGYTLPKDTEIEVSVAYTPDFKLARGTQAEFVSLQAPIVSKTEVEGFTFIPDVTGAYKYVVRFSKGVKQKTETITFTAVDLIAPTLGVISDQTAELGFYPLALDLEEIALNTTDNCATSVTAYPLSVVYGGKETPVEKDAKQLFLDKVGEYTVKFVVEDYSGNKTNGTYKITAKDTTKPVFHVPRAFIAWSKNGKVAVPEIEVADYTLDTVSVTATDKDGTSVAITDNQMQIGQGEYNLTYTATDKSNNVASVTVKMYVQEEGILNTFRSDEEVSVWDGGAARYEDDKLVLLSSADRTEIEYTDYFTVRDWSNYKKLSFLLENRKLTELTVQAELLVNGKWIKTSPQTIAPASLDSDLMGITTSAVEYAVYLDEYACTGADGIRLNFASESSVDVAIDSVTLGKTDDRELPQESSLTGFGAGRYALNAVNGVVSLKGETLSQGNVVNMEIYSTAQASVRIVLKFGDVSVSARRTLFIGENKIARLPALEKGAALSGLTGIEIYNEEAYPITLYVSNVSTANATTLSVESYAIANKTIGMKFGECLRVPSPFLVSNKYYSDLTIRLDDSDGEYLGLKKEGEILETVGDDALPAGVYKLNYFFKDALGASQRIVYTLVVEKKVLSLDIEVPAIVLTEHKDGFTLPDPIINSDELSRAELASAVIKKYYRLQGEAVWNLVENDTFKPLKNTWYEFIYTVDVNGVRAEKTFSKFVHKNTFTLDFESETDVIDTAVKGQGTMVGRFYHDNGYYNYREGSTAHFELDNNWSASGNTSLSMVTPTNGWMGIFIEPFESDKPLNCLTFVFNSEKAYTGGIQIGVDWRASSRYPTRWVHMDVDFKAGVHEYTLFFNETLKANQICAFTVRGLYLHNVAFDDVEFKYMNQLSMSEIECNDTYTMDAYEVQKPTLASDYYSEALLKAAAYKLSYRIGDSAEIIVDPDVNGKYSIVFPKAGEITLTWAVTVKGYTIYKEYKFQVCAFDIETDIPVSGYIGEAIEISAPTSNDYTISDYTVEYQLKGEKTWKVATKNTDSYTFTPEKEGAYYVRVIAHSTRETQQITGEEVQEVYVRDKNNLAVDFEIMEGEEYNVGISDRGYDGCHINLAGLFGLDNTYAHTGNNSMRIQCVNGWWIGYDFMSIKIPKGVYGAIEFWTYTTTPFSMDLAVGTAHLNAAGKEEGQDTVRRLTNVSTGWTKHILPFAKVCAAYDTITEITFSTRTNGRVFYVDDIRFISAELSAELPTTVNYGDTLTMPTCTSAGEMVAAKYRLSGTTNLIDLVDGKATFNREGVWEVVYSFGKFEIAYTVSVAAPTVSELDAAVPTTGVMDTEITLPVGQYQGVTASIEYSFDTGVASEREWISVNDNKVIFETNGNYVLRYNFETFDLEYKISIAIPKFTLSTAMPESVVYGGAFKLPTATYKEETAKVSYREKSTTDWKTVEQTSIKFEKATTYELRYSFKNFEKIYDLEVKLPEVSYSSEFPTKVKQDAEITLPTATSNGETATIEYRREGNDVWTPAVNGKITFKKIMKYEVRYVFSGFEVLKTIVVEDPNVEVLFDFEKPFDKTTISTYGLTNPYTMKDRNGAFEYCRILNSWAHEGNSSLQLVYSQGWDGPLFIGGYELPFATDTFSFVLHHENASLDLVLYLFYYDSTGAMKEKQVSIVGGKTNYAAGTYNITVKAPEAIENIVCFEFKTQLKYYSVDYICAIRNPEL